MEREQFFYTHGIKVIFCKKLKVWLLAGEEIYEPKLLTSKYL